MKTILFVERHVNKNSFRVDYQLNKHNFYRIPDGVIRIARFDSCFMPDNNIGYYGDIYMKQFIRKWKNKTKENIQRRKDLENATILFEIKELCFDVKNIIIEFL